MLTPTHRAMAPSEDRKVQIGNLRDSGVRHDVVLPTCSLGERVPARNADEVTFTSTVPCRKGEKKMWLNF